MKLNRFIILSQEETSASPTASPSSNILTIILQWLSSIPNFFFSLFPKNIKIDWSRILAIAIPILIAVLALLALCCCLPIILNILGFIFYGLWVTCRLVVVGLWVTCRAVVVGLWITCRAVVMGLGVACRWLVVGLGNTCKAVFCCCGSTVRMMKAPGAAGALIARATFEAAPKAYFSALRAGTLVLR